MLPMLGREVVEGEQRIAILDQALDRLLVFGAPGLDQGVERHERILLGLGHPDLLQRAWLSIAGSSAACSARWRSCAPSSADRGSWATLSRSPARSRARRWLSASS